LATFTTFALWFFTRVALHVDFWLLGDDIPYARFAYLALVVVPNTLRSMPIGGLPIPDPVLLFDGECGLCNRVVRVLLRLDRRRQLRFAPLQSPPAQVFLRQRGLPTEDFDTLVFVADWAHPVESVYLVRTAGAMAALRACGGFGRTLAAILAIVPASLRDAAYRFVGRGRYRWFGPWRPRPLARPEWGSRFLA
jgi:predicted DCC family thiol-disulfide oxidoreductase YuxK